MHQMICLKLVEKKKLLGRHTHFKLLLKNVEAATRGVL